MHVIKYHGLGNDYLVLDPAEFGREPAPSEIRLVCDRHYGIGSDGVLWGPLPGEPGSFGLRIYNPDGTEAEKSGNGLRIFARYLHDRGLVADQPFVISTQGGPARCRVLSSGRLVEVEMGRVSFRAEDIPVLEATGEVLDQELELEGQRLRFSAATIGNPHCVLFFPEISRKLACRLGPLLERHPRFPRRTNVQLCRVVDRGHLEIEVWERGAGYTLASGSSSSAAAAVAHRLGFCDRRVVVRMPGGELEIEIGAEYEVKLTGPVVRVGEATLDPEASAAEVSRRDHDGER